MGHIISSKSIKVDKPKVESISKIKTPKNSQGHTFNFNVCWVLQEVYKRYER